MHILFIGGGLLLLCVMASLNQPREVRLAWQAQLKPTLNKIAIIVWGLLGAFCLATYVRQIPGLGPTERNILSLGAAAICILFIVLSINAYNKALLRKAAVQRTAAIEAARQAAEDLAKSAATNASTLESEEAARRQAEEASAVAALRRFRQMQEEARVRREREAAERRSPKA